MTIFSVLTRSTAAQPATPSVGDRYLIPTAATGVDWAGRDTKIGIYTEAGWRFATAPIGSFLYVEDENTFYYRNVSGTWTAGTGAAAFSASSVPISALIGANASVVVKIENQTTNAPPGSPTAPTAYIIGPSPTGSWAGSTGKLAICFGAGAFTILTPVAGDEVYDKNLGSAYRFNGANWVAAAGTWIDRAVIATPGSGSSTAPSAVSVYTYSTIAPTTATRQRVDNASLSYTAKRAGATLRLHYSADVIFSTGVGGVGAGDLVVALFRDSETNAVDWQFISAIKSIATASSVINAHLDHWFEISSSNNASHAYYVSILSAYTSATVLTDAGAPSRRTFEVEESA